MSKPPGYVPMTMTGYCQFPSKDSHEYCQSKNFTCTCWCHEEAKAA